MSRQPRTAAPDPLPLPVPLQGEPGAHSTLVRHTDGVDPPQRRFASAEARTRHWNAVRALRTELLLRHRDEAGADLIALLSPGAREGRSLLAADLALALAATGLSTLLVDGDLHHPSQHTLFGAPREDGLTEALVSRRAPRLHEVHGHPGLQVLMAGDATDDPLEGLSSASMGGMVQFWRSRFDVVVIDTPPATRHSAALLLAQQASRVLLLARAAHTAQHELARLQQRLADLHTPVAGVVLQHF